MRGDRALVPTATFVLLFVVGAPAAALDEETPLTLKYIGKQLENPKRVFPLFRTLLSRGRTGVAHKLLTPRSNRALRPEELYLFYQEYKKYEPARRMISAMVVHKVTVKEGMGTIRICAPEFRMSHLFTVQRTGKVWLLDLTREDVNYLRNTLMDRSLKWFRRQVKQADGWHFAYPPDWNYTPLRRTCRCGR